MPYIRLVKMTFKKGEEKAFLSIFEEVKGRIGSFPGCTHLRLWNDVATPSVFFTYSIWNSETDLENYRNSELFNSTWKRVKPLFAAKAEAWTVEEA